MKTIIFLLFFSFGAFAQIIEVDYNRTAPLMTPERLQANKMYLEYISSVEKAHLVQCEKPKIRNMFRVDELLLRDAILTRCTGESYDVKIRTRVEMDFGWLDLHQIV